MLATQSRKERERTFREELILDTAAAMLVQDGYLGLNLDRLAEKVEYAKGTLYQHFEAKEDLLLAIAARNMKRRAELFDRGATLPGRPRERTVALGVADLVFLYQHPVHFQVDPLVKQPSIWEKGSPKRQQAFDLHAKHCFGVLQRIQEEAVDRGDLDGDKARPEEVTFGLWAMTAGAYTLARSHGLLKHSGIEKPMQTLFRDRSLFLDGVGWKPLSTSWDYGATLSRALKTLFPDISREKLGL